jgi:hypothetical protein
MAPDGESFRGLNAIRLLSKGDTHNDKLIADGYDTKLTLEYLTSFDNNFEKI